MSDDLARLLESSRLTLGSGDAGDVDPHKPRRPAADPVGAEEGTRAAPQRAETQGTAKGGRAGAAAESDEAAQPIGLARATGNGPSKTKTLRVPWDLHERIEAFVTQHNAKDFTAFALWAFERALDEHGG
jgi:hypothetical protein